MDGSAAETLDRIREGSTYVVATAIQRLEECLEAVRDGRFREARRHLEEVANRLDPLSSAETQFGGWDNVRIIRANEIEEGMSIYGWDHVDEILKRYPDPTGDGDTVIVVMGSRGEERKIYASSELIVFNDE